MTSRQNALVRRFRTLAGDGPRGDDVLLDGAHLVEEAAASGVPLEVVAFASDAAAGRLAPLVARLERTAARMVTVPGSLLGAMSPVRSASGVVAIGRLPRRTLADALAQAPQLVLLLDGVQDPGNVGAIIRAAEGCGATGVIAGSGTADPHGWKALRGSMGSTFRLPVATAGSLTDAAAAAHTAGLRLLAAVPRGGTPLDRADLSTPVGIVLGGEGSGLPAGTLDRMDGTLTIAMRPPVESLNVAIAAALVLYEAARQRADVTV